MKSEFSHNEIDNHEDADLIYLFGLSDRPDLALSAIIHDTLAQLRAQANLPGAVSQGGEAADSSHPATKIPLMPSLKELEDHQYREKIKPVKTAKAPKLYLNLRLALVATVVVSLGGLTLLLLLAGQPAGETPPNATTPLVAITATPTEQITNQVILGFEGTGLQDWTLWSNSPQDYSMNLDKTVSHSGQNSALLTGTREEPTNFSMLTRNYDPANYQDKRVRLRAYIKTENVTQWAGLVMRVEGADNNILNFDNMQNRPIVGTTGWKQYSIVLDVPQRATNLLFGTILSGSGKVWLDDVTLEAVSITTGVTSGYATTPVTQFSLLNGGFENYPTINDWQLTGDEPQQYALSGDSQVKYSGQASGLLKYTSDGSPKGFGTMMQTFSAGQYLGKRVRLGAYIRSEGVEDWAGLWLRIDGEQSQELGFDNMENRPIKGTTAWKRYEVVLDVPTESANLNLGVLLTGKGQVWVDDVQLEVVDKTVPTTNMLKS